MHGRGTGAERMVASAENNHLSLQGLRITKPLNYSRPVDFDKAAGLRFVAVPASHRYTGSSDGPQSSGVQGIEQGS